MLEEKDLQYAFCIHGHVNTPFPNVVSVNDNMWTLVRAGAEAFVSRCNVAKGVVPRFGSFLNQGYMHLFLSCLLHVSRAEISSHVCD